MNRSFPLTIIERPHRGKPTEWTLYDLRHFQDIINSDQLARSGYFDWCAQEGCEPHELESYFDWLRHDLSSLEIIDTEELQ